MRGAGIAKTSMKRYEQIASIPEEALEKYISGKRAKKQPVSAKEVVQMTRKPLRRGVKIEKLKARRSRRGKAPAETGAGCNPPRCSS